MKTMSFAAAIILFMTSIAATAQSYPKWLAIGDSITQHGPKPELNWSGETRGMAASMVSEDYVHLLGTLIKQHNPESASEVKIVGRLGKLSGGTMDEMEGVIEELRKWEADLITVQLGENDHLQEIGADGFEKRYRGLIEGLLNGPKRPRIVCTGVWAPADVLPEKVDAYPAGSEAAIKEEIIRRICAEKGLTFVSIAPIALVPENHGDGQSAGVKWHPNDQGMAKYAEALSSAIFGSAATKSTSH